MTSSPITAGSPVGDLKHDLVWSATKYFGDNIDFHKFGEHLVLSHRRGYIHIFSNLVNQLG